MLLGGEKTSRLKYPDGVQMYTYGSPASQTRRRTGLPP